MITMSKSKFNKDFRIVFEPKDPTKFNNRRRFGVSANTLSYYIGEENAEKCKAKADKMKTDKIRIKLRETGIVDFYVK